MPDSWELHIKNGEPNFSRFLLVQKPPPGIRRKLYLLSARGGGSGANWLVGSYSDLKVIAWGLRHFAVYQRFATESDLIFGFRASDRPPRGGSQPKSFGAPAAGPNADRDYTSSRVHPMSQPLREGVAAKNRETDRWKHKDDYWKKRTVEAHHIVEFSNLRNIGESRYFGQSLLDRRQLPCVLLMAEFHQCYISSVLKPTHHWNEDDLRKGLAKVYRDIYTKRSMGPSSGLRLDPLWDVSRVVLKAAGVSTKITG